MPRIIQTIDDPINLKTTFVLDNGDCVAVDSRETHSPLLSKMLASMAINPDQGRVDVIQYGHKVGELPAWWHPGIGRSKHWLYDFRQHDLELVNGKWVAHPTLGAKDLDYLIGFVRKD